MPDGCPVDPSTALQQLAELRALHLARFASRACAPRPVLDRVLMEEVPDRWRALSPLDTLWIHAAFAQVNAHRLAAVRYLTKPRRASEEERPSWSVFLAGLADRTRRSPRYVGRHRSLVNWLAQVSLAAPSFKEEVLGE
ncbi:MAG: hypothetical protein JO040_10535 [Gemmatimonadetes bacterium]|nr:hypothetical protein [Gemmatimonadota bacterium]